MVNVFPDIVSTKNEWLYSQIDVEFPTVASKKGYQLQLEYCQNCDVTRWYPSDKNITCPFDLFPVNFHRLTVYFAVLQSKLFSSPEDQESIIEFYTQIIYSDPCQLYVGFKDQEPVFAGMVTKNDNQILFSNFVSTDKNVSLSNSAQYIYDVIAEENSNQSMYYLENCLKI